MPESYKPFIRRNNPRVPFACKFIAHNDKKVFHGEMIDLSVRGFSFSSDNNLLPVGSRFTLHMKSGYGLSPFNVRCEIKARKSVVAGSKSKKIVVKYSVVFLNLPVKSSEEIKNLIQYCRRNIA